MEPKQVFNKQIIASFANAAMLAQAVNALRCKPVTNSLEAITSEAIVLRRFNQRLFIFFQGNSSFFWIRFYVNNFNLLFNCFFYILFTSTALDGPGLRPNEGWMRYIKIYL